MFSLYLTLTKALRDKVPTLRTIDLDKGQLVDPESYESISQPGVLVSEFDIEWTQLSQRREQGVGTVTVKTVVRLPSRTHQHDPLVDLNVEALLIADDVHDITLNVPGITNRTASKCYPAGTFYVVENTYACLLTYGGPNFRAVPVALTVHPSLHNPASA